MNDINNINNSAETEMTEAINAIDSLVKSIHAEISSWGIDNMNEIAVKNFCEELITNRFVELDEIFRTTFTILKVSKVMNVDTELVGSLKSKCIDILATITKYTGISHYWFPGNGMLVRM